MALILLRNVKSFVLRQVFSAWLVETLRDSKVVLDATVQALAAQHAKKAF